jgi:hypothetical protein
MRTQRPTVTITTRKKNGRPALSASAAPSPDVHLTLAPEDYEAAWALAQAERISVQEIFRRAFAAYLREKQREQAGND